MADYTDSMKMDVGDLCSKIRDTKNELLRQENAAKEMVKALRALADVYDPDCEGKRVVNVGSDFFTTTHASSNSDSHQTINGKKYPRFRFPKNVEAISQHILELKKS